MRNSKDLGWKSKDINSNIEFKYNNNNHHGDEFWWLRRPNPDGSMIIMKILLNLWKIDCDFD